MKKIIFAVYFILINASAFAGEEASRDKRTSETLEDNLVDAAENLNTIEVRCAQEKRDYEQKKRQLEGYSVRAEKALKAQKDMMKNLNHRYRAPNGDPQSQAIYRSETKKIDKLVHFSAGEMIALREKIKQLDESFARKNQRCQSEKEIYRKQMADINRELSFPKAITSPSSWDIQRENTPDALMQEFQDNFGFDDDK